MKMKKKDKTITVLCILWIVLILCLKFNGEYTIARMEDLSELEIIQEENLLLKYSIGKNRETLSEDELTMAELIERQIATLCILEDGSVYFLNTFQPIKFYLEDNALSTITYSAYYMGRLSTLDLLFLECNRALIDPEAKREGIYPDAEEPGGSKVLDDVVYYFEGGNKSLKQRQYSFYVHGIGENHDEDIQVARNTITGEYWSITLDVNAIVLIPWLRTSWHYREYIDLMYHELYPWLVEE